MNGPGLGRLVGVDAVNVTTANYETAQRLIQDGHWRVDADAGVVYGIKGRPMIRRNNSGYVQSELPKLATGTRRGRPAVLIHRVIWEYVNGPLGSAEVNHINGDKLDNRIENLEVCTRGENNAHAFRTGLRLGAGAKLTAEQVVSIRQRMQAGERNGDLAIEYDLHPSVMSTIRHRRRWHNV